MDFFMNLQWLFSILTLIYTMVLCVLHNSYVSILWNTMLHFTFTEHFLAIHQLNPILRVSKYSIPTEINKQSKSGCGPKILELSKFTLGNPGYLNQGIITCYWVHQKKITGMRRARFMFPCQEQRNARKKNWRKQYQGIELKGGSCFRKIRATSGERPLQKQGGKSKWGQNMSSQ